MNPAINKIYYKDGIDKEAKDVNEDRVLHRDCGPAILDFDFGPYRGCEFWVEGKRHNLNGPAVVRSDNTKMWYVNGELHREDGPAIEWGNGSVHYYVNGKLHREDGPAIEYSCGTIIYAVDDKYHNTEGPAVIYEDGTMEYWVNGKEFTRRRFSNKFGGEPLEKIKKGTDSYCKGCGVRWNYKPEHLDYCVGCANGK